MQCLHTSEAISQRNDVRPSSPCPSPGRVNAGMPRFSTGETRVAVSCAVGRACVPSSPPPRGACRSSGSTASADNPDPDAPVGSPASPGSCRPVDRGCSMNATCRHEFAPSEPVLSNDMPSRSSPSSGTAFHVLHATSQALQPMQTEVSVKNPTRSGWSTV